MFLFLLATIGSPRIVILKFVLKLKVTTTLTELTILPKILSNRLKTARYSLMVIDQTCILRSRAILK